MWEREIYTSNPLIATITIPYIEGISDRIKRTLMKRGIRTVFRTIQTLRYLLTRVKPTLTDLDEKGVIYQVHCRTVQRSTYVKPPESKTLDSQNTSDIADSCVSFLRPNICKGCGDSAKAGCC